MAAPPPLAAARPSLKPYFFARELLEREEPPLRDEPDRVDPPLRDELDRDDELLRDELLRAEPDRVDPPLREPDPLERDDVDREPLDRDELDVPDLRARVVAPFFAAALRLAVARLRVAAPFFAAAERDFDELPPRTLLSSSSARPRSSSTVPCTSRGALVPASAIARAARLRMPLSRRRLKRSLSRADLAIRLLLHLGCGRRISTRAARASAPRSRARRGLLSATTGPRLPLPAPVLA